MDKPTALKATNFDALPKDGILVYHAWDRHGRTIIVEQYKPISKEDGGGLREIPAPPSLGLALKGFNTAIPEYSTLSNGVKMLTGCKNGTASDADGCNLVEINIDINGGVAKIQYVYKTQTPAGDEGAGVVDVEVNGIAHEISIKNHKDFTPMFAWYGAFVHEGHVYWMDYDPGNPSVTVSGEKRKFNTAPAPQRKVVTQSTTALGTTTATANNNPMLGVQSFYEGRIEVSETRFYKSRSAIPSDVVDKVGSVDNTSDGEASGLLSSFEKKKWIRSGARVVSSGSGYRVTRSWMLNNMDRQETKLKDSPESMWIPEIYSSVVLTAAPNAPAT